MSRFVAIDFETANRRRDSACALGLVVCEHGEVLETREWLICPPSREFVFTDIHGLSWSDVCDAPSFAELWPQLEVELLRADFVVAHNAPFDRSVLRACCERSALPVPDISFECTVRLARKQWNIYPTRLPNVCHELGIALRHHDAGSDAQACAQIVLAAQAQGWVHQAAG